MVLFSLVPVGYATNAMGGAGGPLAVLVTAISAAEFGKATSMASPMPTRIVTMGVTRMSTFVSLLTALPCSSPRPSARAQAGSATSSCGDVYKRQTDATLLVDTYNSLQSGVPNAIRAFNEVLKPLGICLLYTSRCV